MAKLADYPLTGALLRELCQLEAADEAMPLTILVNVYRGRLREPLAGLTRLFMESYLTQTAETAKWLNDLVRERYGVDGELLQLDDDLAGLFTLAIVDEYPWNAVVEDEPEEEKAELLWAARDNWFSYDPIALLTYLTHPGIPLVPLAAVLERELELLPTAAEMVLAFANVQPGADV
jgi:hypothetical protein